MYFDSLFLFTSGLELEVFSDTDLVFHSQRMMTLSKTTSLPLHSGCHSLAQILIFFTSPLCLLKTFVFLIYFSCYSKHVKHSVCIRFRQHKNTGKMRSYIDLLRDCAFFSMQDDPLF